MPRQSRHAVRIPHAGKPRAIASSSIGRVNAQSCHGAAAAPARGLLVTTCIVAADDSERVLWQQLADWCVIDLRFMDTASGRGGGGA